MGIMRAVPYSSKELKRDQGLRTAPKTKLQAELLPLHHHHQDEREVRSHSQRCPRSLHQRLQCHQVYTRDTNAYRSHAGSTHSEAAEGQYKREKVRTMADWMADGHPKGRPLLCSDQWPPGRNRARALSFPRETGNLDTSNNFSNF